MKFLKTLILFFITIVVTGFNIGTISIIQIANASDFSDAYEFRLKLVEPVPFRVYSLNDPNRIVLELDTSAINSLNDLEITSSPLLGEINFTKLIEGWSAITIKVDTPVKVQNLAMKPKKIDGSKVELSFELLPVEQQEFDSIVTLFNYEINDKPLVKEKKNFHNYKSNNLTVVIDPGHGGVDPGAQVKNIREADLMLSLARVVAEELERIDNTTVVLTRNSDEFMSLDKRLMVAVRAGGDLFISLHADTVKKGKASGSTVYTLSQKASDQASARLASRHGGDELISGLDLTGAGTAVTSALMGLLRSENTVRAAAFSQSIVKNLKNFNIRLNSAPLRKANFSVLKLPSVPSILIETGFMSTSSDLKNLQDRDWAEKFASAISLGIVEWVAADRLLANKRMQ